MSDSFSDLWNATAPSKQAPQKLGSPSPQLNNAAPITPSAKLTAQQKPTETAGNIYRKRGCGAEAENMRQATMPKPAARTISAWDGLDRLATESSSKASKARASLLHLEGQFRSKLATHASSSSWTCPPSPRQYAVFYLLHLAGSSSTDAANATPRPASPYLLRTPPSHDTVQIFAQADVAGAPLCCSIPNRPSRALSPLCLAPAPRLPIPPYILSCRSNLVFRSLSVGAEQNRGVGWGLERGLERGRKIPAAWNCSSGSGRRVELEGRASAIEATYVPRARCRALHDLLRPPPANLTMAKAKAKYSWNMEGAFPSFSLAKLTDPCLFIHSCAPVLVAEGDVAAHATSRLGYTTRRDKRQRHLGLGLASTARAQTPTPLRVWIVRRTGHQQGHVVSRDVVFAVPELSYRERRRLSQFVILSTRCLGCARRPKRNVEMYTADLGHRHRD
ncbi:hypothetical protein C8R45DRAFT_1213568 [Mycena sanguinolenta]|nr:hypothetical protein C8R45DRAFT_1213568 [Mycena sanguinolenta]